MIITRLFVDACFSNRGHVFMCLWLSSRLSIDFVCNRAQTVLQRGVNSHLPLPQHPQPLILVSQQPGQHMDAVWEDWDVLWIWWLLTTTTQEGCFSGIDLENIHHCLWFRSAVQRRWSVPNRFPVGFLSSFSQGCSTLSSQRWQSRIPKPGRGARWSPPPSFSLHSHTLTHTLQLNSPTHEPTTTRHPNVSVSSPWIVSGNLELSQVIPNYLNLQKADILSHLSEFCAFLPPHNLGQFVVTHDSLWDKRLVKN